MVISYNPAEKDLVAAAISALRGKVVVGKPFDSTQKPGTRVVMLDALEIAATRNVANEL